MVLSDIDIRETLVDKGIRPTHQRIAVYKFLLQNHTHPSADDIYKELSQIHPVFSRTTIYNSLKILLEAKLIRSVSISIDEQRFDAFSDDHGHFICTKCSEIFDFDISKAEILKFSPKGFKCVQSDVFLSGTCPSCSTN